MWTVTRAPRPSASARPAPPGPSTPVAVHGKDRVGHDEPATAPRSGGELGLQGLHVAVGVDVDAGPREPAPVDDARVVEGIAEDVVAAADERRDRAHVRLVAGGKEERRLG